MAAVQELVDCMVSNWYPRFQKAAFKTLIIPLPQPVLDWLVSDGLHLPADSQAFATRGPLDEYASEDEYREWSSEDEDSPEQPPPPELDELRRQLAAAIDELGGRVVPKLSWSCPIDAIWMSPTSTLACTNPDEVLLLLQASDRVAHDVCHALQDAAAVDAAGPPIGSSSGTSNGSSPAPASTVVSSSSGSSGSCGTGGADVAAARAVQHCLALRRWHDLQPGREFRCFVRRQVLVGASQRDVTQCFPFLLEERDELAAALQAFHFDHIAGRFPHPTFAYDVYVATSGAVRLLDFNPAGGTTAPLLFTWEELLPELAQHAQRATPAVEEPPGSLAAHRPGSQAGSQPAAAAAELQEGSGGEGQPGAATPAACQPHCCGSHKAASTAAVAPTTEQGSYLNQLRRVQALSLASQGQPGGQPQQQQQAPAHPGMPAVVVGGEKPTCGQAAAAPCCAQPTSGAEPAAPLHESGAASSPSIPAAGAETAAADAEVSSAAPGQAAAASQAHAQEASEVAFELRVVEEAVAMRPHTLAYGVPYDFVDDSEGSALERLMAQAQQSGAAELWGALAAQRVGGGGGGAPSN